MGWTERQKSMLQEMGIRLWAPVVAEPAIPKAEAAAEAPKTPAPTVDAVASPPLPATVPSDERSTAIATMPWPVLREAVAACTACSLCQSRRQTVFGVGHPNAHWMIVGEAPGEQEDLKGEPFVGAAGHLLDNMLRALNLTREQAPPERQVYIANTLKCRPPRNRNPEARGTGALRALPGTADRADPSAPDPGDGPLRGALAAAQQRADRQAARARAPLPGRAAGRHLPPGLSAAQPGRQVARLGRPVPGRADGRCGRAAGRLMPALRPSSPSSAVASLR